MALKMFMAVNQRQNPAYVSDSKESLLEELKVFNKSVVKPALEFVRQDIRNLNLLSLREDAVD